MSAPPPASLGRAAAGRITDARERRRRILRLALPICGGMVSQNVLNLVDTGMVASLGDVALAAVGLGSFLNFLLTAFILGLSAGVQAMASRRVGEARPEETAVPLNGGIVLAVCVGVPLSIALIGLAPHLFALVNDDPAVLRDGTPYLQVRLIAMAAMGINFSFRGYWNAIDRSMLYMSTLVVMHVANITLNWVLIYGNLGAPALGATGAGLASAIATWLGTLCYFGLGLKHARGAGFLRALPDRDTLGTMIRVSTPSGLQQLFFAGGMTVLMSIIGRVGTSELAASKVILDLMLVAILPGLGFGLAAASLVGQALGRRDPEDAERWIWDVVRLASTVVGLLSVPAILAPELLLRIFLHDPATLALAAWPMRLVALFLALDTVGTVLMNAMVGAGATKRVMLISTSAQWLLFLPAAWLVGPVLGLGLVAIWVAQIVYRQLLTLAFVAELRRGGWKTMQV
ncbi:MAG: MATE family efflux transporter [Myxococcales bacterium]|nr:MATE family efflux transporter [Myxococcales bacterium]